MTIQEQYRLIRLERRIEELEAQINSLTTLDRNQERRLQEVEKGVVGKCCVDHLNFLEVRIENLERKDT